MHLVKFITSSLSSGGDPPPAIREQLVDVQQVTTSTTDTENVVNAWGLVGESVCFGDNLQHVCLCFFLGDKSPAILAKIWETSCKSYLSCSNPSVHSLKCLDTK